MRLFVAPGALAAGELRVTGDELHYLARVRRARVGDLVELVDGAGGRAPATVAAIDADTAVLRVGAPERIAPRPPLVRALVPPIKGDRMDTCLEKLVEVGVDEIVIWPAARLRVALDPASDGELSRLPLEGAAEVTVASGPEGGLAPAELEQLARAGFVSVGLGPRVLRAETAPVVAVALIRAATRS